MKTLLAWLDWSSYCHNERHYEFPKSRCPLFWRTLFSVLSLPIMWLGHIYNLIFQNKDFWREESSGWKAHIWSVLIIHVIVFGAATGGHGLTDDTFNWDWFHLADGFFINYFKMIGVGLIMVILGGIGIAIVIGAVVGVVLGCKRIFKKEQKYIPAHVDEGGKFVEATGGDELTGVGQAIHAFKNKFCPRMDWSSIRNKN